MLQHSAQNDTRRFPHQEDGTTTEQIIRAPDLQELVRQFGGYNKIAAEGWAEFDRAMAEFQQRRREAYGALSRRARLLTR